MTNKSTNPLIQNNFVLKKLEVGLADTLDLQSAVHIGHSAGGGEVARYVALAKPGRVAKMVLISAVPPMLRRAFFALPF